MDFTRLKRETSIDAPPGEEEIKAASSVACPRIFLVRNATSVHNYWSQIYSHRARLYKGDPQPEEDPIYKFLEEVHSKWDTRLLDPGLHKNGIHEAEEARKVLLSHPNIRHVFVSPMLRSLETCRVMLDDYPGKERLKIVVHPLLRNLMGDAEDIPCNTVSVIKREYEQLHDLHFDFSLLTKAQRGDLYFVESMNSPEKEQILEETSKDPKGYAAAIIRLAREKRRTGKKRHRKLETHENIRRRAILFGEYIEQFIQSHDVKPDEDILIFTQGSVMKYCLSLFWGPDGRALAQRSERCALAEFDHKKLLELHGRFSPVNPVHVWLSQDIEAMPRLERSMSEPVAGMQRLYVSSPMPGTEKLLFPLRTCAKGHQLFFSRNTTGYESYDCVRCLKGGKCQDGRWNCMFCKYNLCPMCRPPPKGDAAKRLCISGHRLNEEDVGEDEAGDFNCAKCGKKCHTKPGGRKASCVCCSYDVCDNCYIGS